MRFLLCLMLFTTTCFAYFGEPASEAHDRRWDVCIRKIARKMLGTSQWKGLELGAEVRWQMFGFKGNWFRVDAAFPKAPQQKYQVSLFVHFDHEDCGLYWRDNRDAFLVKDPNDQTVLVSGLRENRSYVHETVPPQLP